MARWKPDAPLRLQEAALELFATHGYEQTTATEIAQAVGLTERTFYRHFSDKREVLFYGQEEFVQTFLGGVDEAPQGASAFEIVASVLRSAAAAFPDDRRPFARTRHGVIEQNPPLRERESHKLSHLAAAVSEALRARGIDEIAAKLAGESCITVFGIAFTQWVSDGEQRSLAEIAAQVLGELLSLTGR